MNKSSTAPQPIENVALGSTIGMLDGVVRLDSWTKEADGTYTYYVSLGRLKNHRMRGKSGMVQVYSVPDDIAPWFGV